MGLDTLWSGYITQNGEKVGSFDEEESEQAAEIISTFCYTDKYHI